MNTFRYFVFLAIISLIAAVLFSIESFNQSSLLKEDGSSSNPIDSRSPGADFSLEGSLQKSAQRDDLVPVPLTSTATPPGQSVSTLNELSGSEQESLWMAFSDARREVRAIPEAWSERAENIDYDYYALHPNQNLTTRFGDRGVQIVSSDRTYTKADSKDPTTAWQVQMRLLSFAGEKVRNSSTPHKSSHSSTLLEYHHSSKLTEWFDNNIEGIEHGYTIAERPTHLGSEEDVSLEVEVDGLSVEVQERDDDLESLAFLEEGREILSYSKLIVVDAHGKRLPASMKPTSDGFSISFNDAMAAYPVTVDPIIANEEAKFGPTKSGDDDFFGVSVAISSYTNTAVIGAYGDDDAGMDAGATFVFTRVFSHWYQQARLTASDATAGDNFGHSVSIYWDSVVIGASGDDDGGVNSGSAYVFVRSGSTWIQQGKLTATDAAADDSFGSSVGIHNDSVVVGAFGDEDDGVSSGSAYIFARNGAAWTQQSKLTASDPAAGDEFGSSVSISGISAVIGAPFDDDGGSDSGSAYVFIRSHPGTTWSEQAKLTASDDAAGDNFGCSVSISSHSLLIGASQDDDGGVDSGSAYVFTRSGTTWTEQAKLTASDAEAEDNFGSSVSLDFGNIVIGAPFDDDGGNDSGSAYIFFGSGSNWSEQAKLAGSGAAAGNSFGSSVAIAENAAIIGVPLDDNGPSNSGSAYIFSRIGSTWSDQGYLTNTSASDQFGGSVSISGDTVIIGSHSDDDGGTHSGSAYVFTREGEIWSLQAKLIASDAGFGDVFGSSVSISGDTVIIGARLDDEDGMSSGSAYVFSRAGSTWSQQAKLTASDAAAADYFGSSVAISGDTVVIGASGNDGVASDSGSVYVFTRNNSLWAQQARLTASDAAAGDFFGSKVAISGDSVIVGAYGNDDAGSYSGSAYIFARNGSTWSQQAKLTASDAAANDYFGWPVAISDDYVVIGSRFDDDDGSASGSAYVFARTGTAWSQQSKLTAADAAAGDNFGFSTGISGDSIIIGAFGDDDNGNYSGSAYYFTRHGTSWHQNAKLTASDAEAGDQFGTSAAISGDTAIIGAYGDDDGGADSGSAYPFRFPRMRAFDWNDLSIVRDGSAQAFPPQLIEPGQPFVFTLHNIGTLGLDLQSISLGGDDAGEFILTRPDISATSDLAQNESLEFSIVFNPTGPISGIRNATIEIISNDRVSEFTFAISGMGFSGSSDVDNDGMNDWAEYLLSRYGFDWQVTQTNEVDYYYNNALAAALFAKSEAATVTGSVKLAEVDSSTDSAAFIFSFEESLDLETSTKHNVDPSRLSVDGDGNIRYELDAATQKKFYHGRLKP